MDAFTKAIADIVMNGTGLVIVIFLGTAIVRDLIRDLRGK